MPSRLHETLIDMFRDRPALAAELLAGPLGVPIPAFQQASLSSGELTDVRPTEYRADAVVTLTVNQKPVLAVVIEAQLRRDQHKRRTWPVYVATLHARLRCHVMLLVVSPNKSVAAWCAEPIVIGNPCLVLTPLVLGPADVPLVTDEAAAQHNPQLAILSAMTHGAGPGQAGALLALLAALDVLDHDQASLYADVVLAVLPAAARVYLEALMTTTTHGYQSDFARRYFSQGEASGEARGEARGEAKALLGVLAARGVEVSDEVREQITSCTDLEQLEGWIRRAATADAVEDLFV